MILLLQPPLEDVTITAPDGNIYEFSPAGMVTLKTPGFVNVLTRWRTRHYPGRNAWTVTAAAAVALADPRPGYPTTRLEVDRCGDSSWDIEITTRHPAV